LREAGKEKARQRRRIRTRAMAIWIEEWEESRLYRAATRY
jgi:hypothetical protein